MSDPNKLLDDIRNTSSSLLKEIEDGYDSEVRMLGEQLARAIIKLDIACLDGKLPDGWALSKLSKSNQ